MKELKISQLVDAQTEVAEVYTPPAGKKILITKFCGSAAFSPNAVIRLEWKYDTENKVIIWTIKGEEPMPFKYLINVENDNDKLAVILENSGITPLYLSGYIEFEELE